MVTTLPLEHLACLKYVIKQAGHIPSAKYKTDPYKSLHGHQMELFALALAETATLSLVKL